MQCAPLWTLEVFLIMNIGYWSGVKYFVAKTRLPKAKSSSNHLRDVFHENETALKSNSRLLTSLASHF